MVGLNIHAIRYFFHVHRSFFGKKFGKQAVMFRVQVLDQDKGHARVHGQMTHQFRKSFNSAGRSPDGSNQ